MNLCEGGTFGGATPKTEKWRNSVKKALKGKPKTPEHIEAVRKAITNNPKLKAAIKKQWDTPGFREKMSKIHKEIWAKRKAGTV